jgi:hypothetical protein
VSGPAPAPAPPPAPPAAPTPPPAARRPPRTPPSVGGAALAFTAGLVLTQGLVSSLRTGDPVPVQTWVLPPVMLLFTVLLLGVMAGVRRRLGAPLSPQSARQQQAVVGLALLVGLGVGAAWAWA